MQRPSQCSSHMLRRGGASSSSGMPIKGINFKLYLRDQAETWGQAHQLELNCWCDHIRRCCSEREKLRFERIAEQLIVTLFSAGSFPGHFLFDFFTLRVSCSDVFWHTDSAERMSFPQLGYPQYLSASQAVYGVDRPGVLTPSSRGGSAEIAGNQSAAAAAVTSVLGMYANPYTAHNYSAFLPYSSADLALFSQMVRAISILLVLYCSGLYCCFTSKCLTYFTGKRQVKRRLSTIQSAVALQLAYTLPLRKFVDKK